MDGARERPVPYLRIPGAEATMPEPFDFASLGLGAADEVPRLLGRCPDIEPLAYREGEYLIREDEASQDIFIVLQGALAVERAPAVPGGAPAMLACILAEPGAPAIVGEMAYLGAMRRSASVRSSGLSRALRLRPAHIEQVLEGFPELTRMICRQFSNRLRETDRSLHELQARFALNPTRRMAQAEERLFAASDPATTLYQLMAGTVRLERNGETRVLAADQLPMGLLELEPFLRGGVHAAAATVEGMAFLAEIPAGDREAVVRCFPELVLGILAGR
jgi:CRP-like cAMP-binding protein